MTNEVGLYTLSSTRYIKNKNDSIFLWFRTYIDVSMTRQKISGVFLSNFRNFGVIHRLDVLMGCLSLFLRLQTISDYCEYYDECLQILHQRIFIFIIFILTRLIEYHAQVVSNKSYATIAVTRNKSIIQFHCLRCCVLYDFI